MLKIKTQYIGSTVKKGVSSYYLSDSLSQKEIQFIGKMVSPYFIEEVTEDIIEDIILDELIEKVEEKKTSKKIKNDKNK